MNGPIHKRSYETRIQQDATRDHTKTNNKKRHEQAYDERKIKKAKYRINDITGLHTNEQKYTSNRKEKKRAKDKNSDTNEVERDDTRDEGTQREDRIIGKSQHDKRNDNNNNKRRRKQQTIK